MVGVVLLVSLAATGCSARQGISRTEAKEMLALANMKGRVHYVVHFDESAFRVAQEVVEAEYARRNCAGTSKLFGSVTYRGAFVYREEMCGDAVDNQRGTGNKLWFVTGSWHLLPHGCSDSGDSSNPTGIVMSASECLRFTLVGRSGTTYPYGNSVLMLVRKAGRWQVVWEDTGDTWSGGGEKLWPRRTENPETPTMATIVPPPSPLRW